MWTSARTEGIYLFISPYASRNYFVAGIIHSLIAGTYVGNLPLHVPTYIKLRHVACIALL
jgi:hypothetical protein